MKRFRKLGDVEIFEPTPLKDIEFLHADGEEIIQPCLYVPGELLVRRTARRDAERLLGARIEYRVVGTGPGGVLRIQVPIRRVPELALDLELEIRGSRGGKPRTDYSADAGLESGGRTDADIRAALDGMGLRSNEPTLVSPNHIFTPTPVCGVGPATEPVPAKPIPAPRGSAGRGVRIAVVDTGIFRDTSQHPWLQRDVHFSLSDVEPPDADGNGFIDPVSGHGHFVAGIIRRAAPGATIFVERLFHNGKLIQESQLATALEDIVRQDPHIINLSLTGQTWGGGPPAALAPVWREIRSKVPEIVVVAAAGNAGKPNPFWPAAQPEVVSVGAVDENNYLPTDPVFSNYGNWVKVYARGVRVVNAFTTGRYRYQEPPTGTPPATFRVPFCSWSGTSFATPLVTGRIAARMTQANLSAADARDAVIRDARSAGTNSVGRPAQTAPDGSPIYIVQ